MADLLSTASLAATSASAPSPNNGDNNAAAATAKKDSSSNDPPLRQGKWTREEEDYVHCLIDEFKTGMMPLAEGTSLRTFLSKMLNCHPMRISKKFVGSNYNGKQVYVRRTGSNRLSNDEVRARRAKLCELEQKFLAKVSPGGLAASMNTPSAQNTLPTPNASQVAMSMGNLVNHNNSSAPQLQAIVSLHNMQNHKVAASTASNGIGLRGLDSAQTQMMEVPLKDAPQSNPAGSNNSTAQLQNIFQELMVKTGGDAMEAFQLLQQQQQQQSQFSSARNHSKANINNRAAAAGRALLQSGLGLDDSSKNQASRSSRGLNAEMPKKDLGSFTSAELAAELRKRSSLKDLKDLMSTLGGGNNSSSGNNNRQHSSSLANFQDALHQQSGNAAGDSHAAAFSSFMRNPSLDISNLIERQGSIDSLSNLASRSRLQSLQSLSSLLDPIDPTASTTGLNKNWTPHTDGNATKVSMDHIGAYRKTANDFMESLGVGRPGFNNFGSAAASKGQAQSNNNNSSLRNSGINLASLLNNDDALRRLQETAPSSLPNSSWNFDNHSSSRQQQQQQQGADSNIAQFLLQKKLMEAQERQQQQNNDDSHQLNAASASSFQNLNNNNSSSNNSNQMDPFMSSLIASLKSTSGGGGGGGDDSINNNSNKQNDDMETLKRKFFSQEGFMATASQVHEEQRRNKPFR